MRELATINELVGRAGSYASLRFATDTADPERGALLQRDAGARDRDRDASCCSSSSSGRRSTTSTPTSCSPRDGPRLLPPLPAQRPPLPPAPAVRARGEDPRREVDLQPERLGTAVRRARLGAARQPRRRRGSRSTSRSAACSTPTARRAARRRRGGLGGARAGAAHARVHLQHARPRQVGRGPAALLPALARGRNLANEASDESVMALIEAVRRPLRHPAALVPAQGEAARRRPARATTTARRRCCRGRHVLVRRGARAGDRHLRSFSPEAGRIARRFFDEQLDRRAGPRRTSAAARSAPTRCRRSTPTCCSTSPRAGATC